jgi:pseudouridine-5'-phosphate glycosidase/pseudouridine kinase
MLISPLGRDLFGSLLKEGIAALGMRTDGLSYPPASSSFLNGASSSRTAVCNMVLDSRGDLVGGIADMDIIASMRFEEVRLPILNSPFELLTIIKIVPKLPSSAPVPLVAMFDGNIGSSVMAGICQWAYDRKVASEFRAPV